MRSATLVAWLVLGVMQSPTLSAQEASTHADSTTTAFDLPDEPPTPHRWAPFGDLRLRGDFATGLPANRDDLERGRATLRAGLRWMPAASFDVEASFRASLATDHNADERRNFDNETPDDFDLDRATLRWRPDPDAEFAAGKLELPLRLTQLVWDEDRRLVGATATGRWPFGRDALRLAATAALAHRFDGDEAQIYGGQASWLVAPDAPAGGDLAVAALGFDGLDEDPAEQLQRQNRVATPAGPRLASRFALLDAQLGLRAPFGDASATVRLDVVRNLRADDDADGLRARVAIGRRQGELALEAGYVYQRVEREAVPGSFNGDDWWFHSADRGHSIFMSAGWADVLELRVSGFDERRDDVSEHTRRLLIELTARTRAR